MTKEEILEGLNAMRSNTMLEMLELSFIDVNREEGWVKVKMPVTDKVKQPMGLLHGGASAALAESVGSASSLLYLDIEKQATVGIQLSCNHVRSVRQGHVIGTARILHKGKSTHLWQIEIRDEEDRLISHCKLTNMVIDRK